MALFFLGMPQPQYRCEMTAATKSFAKVLSVAAAYPETRYLPASLEFLGYQPVQPGPSVSESLRYFLWAAGLAQE